MTAVFISSESGDKDIITLFSLLSRSAEVSVICGELVDIKPSPDFLLLSLKERPIRLNCRCAAVLFCDAAAAWLLPDDCPVLCFDEESASRCTGKNRQIISCGMHGKDTVTLSSMENGKPVLSLQRRLAAFSGESVEVGDYPLVTNEQDHRMLMAASALLLLCSIPLLPDSFS